MERTPHGFLVIDKPAGMTSRDVVNRALGWFPRRTRIGHAGTLDPLATGVLPLAIGTATRLIEYVQRWDKEYEAVIRLGATSTTDDAEGTIAPAAVKVVPDRAAVEQTLVRFVGMIEQVPPAYSAAKVAGRRAHDLARRGQAVDLAQRRVRIDHIDLLHYDYPRLGIAVRCGKGTYIRSLARDLGQRLGCGGLIEKLRRTRVGRFHAADAIALDASREIAWNNLLPLEIAVAELPRLDLGEMELSRLRCGGPVALPAGSGGEAGEFAVHDSQGRLVLVARVAEGRLWPDKVLSPM